MQAIEFEAIPQHHAITIPEGIPVADGLPLRVLLLIDTLGTGSEKPSCGEGGEEIFYLLAGLSDDFMADRRQQLPLQVRADL
ncbi:MAG: hypothetical protein WC091_21635 [Sulfuricellaceae bacterium]